MTDFGGYQEMAEFHDLFMDRAWQNLEPLLRHTFGHLPATATVVDLGAGSGLGTRTLARASDAQIVAVEPSLVMRSILLARVVDNPDLARRVSVLAAPVPKVLAELPEQVDGALCAHVLGHLDAEERSAWFAWLATHLTPQARAVVTISPEAGAVADNAAVGTGSRSVRADRNRAAGPEGVSASDQPLQHRRIGRHMYTADYSEPGPGLSRATYRVTHAGRVLRELDHTSSWVPVTAAQLQSEAATAGLCATTITPSVAVLQRRA